MPYDLLTRSPQTPKRSAPKTLAVETGAGEPDHLSSTLASPHFSMTALGATLRGKNIEIEDLSHDIKAELRFLCSINTPDLRRRPGFCDELIRWTHRHINAIPENFRRYSRDSAILLSIQKHAVNQLFMPDSGQGPAQDRWQLLRDFFNASEKLSDAAPRKRMELADPGHDYSYAAEFRYSGHMSVLKWMDATEKQESIGEYIKRDRTLDDSTYGRHSDARSFVPAIKNGLICHPAKGTITRDRYIYALSPEGTLILGSPSFRVGVFHHSYLHLGRRVICAGEMAIQDGRIIAMNRRSGHYKPEAEHLEAAIDILRSKGVIGEPFMVMHYAAIDQQIFTRYSLDKASGKRHPSLPPILKKYRLSSSGNRPAWQETADALLHAFRSECVFDQITPDSS